MILHFSMSLDGYIAGPAVSAEHPMGRGGERLHEWLFSENKSAVDIESAREMRDAVGAVVLGKRTFDVGIGLWQGTPYAVPCFVLTHAARDDLVQSNGTFVFVTGGIESAVRHARASAGGKDVVIMGAEMARQALKAGLVEVINLQLVPVLLGSGSRLFEPQDGAMRKLECIRAVESPLVAHLRYRVVR
ncbi:MAG: dihydrofolate reductase family protein [Pseudoxanthomonas sp.]